MEKEEGEENQKKIEEYERLLKQKDEELEALTNEQLKDVYGFDEMDIDNDENGNGHEVNDGERRGEKAGDTQGEEQAKEESEDKKKSADDPVPSIELNQGGSSSDNLFTSETDPSDESDSESAVFSDPEYGRALYSRPGPKSIKGAETVGWARPSGRTTLYINRYGQTSAASYLLEKFAQTAESLIQ
ncbi:hypothetical protein F5883DRAFT_697842 [Diaporthe sp. PMI_573]|nr:hypothetical protein F5883DRAFT_697842 [Diaporthaceae sp. PMI_573]